MRISLMLIISTLLNLAVYAQGVKQSVPSKTAAPVVIVSSYNPDVRSISDNISDFYSEFTASNLKNPIVVEDINALNLPDYKEWHGRMHKVLDKYYAGGKRPACIVLLGNEASSTFFSLDDPKYKSTPVVVGMRGSAIVKIPKDTVDLKKWEPTCYEITTDFRDFNIVGGEVYHYNIKKNLNLLKHFYPKCDTITFLSDNTLGGITMRALFRKYIKTDRRFVTKYIDGRTMSFVDADEIISNLPSTQAMVLGTWRVDSSNRYVVRNTTYTFCQNNPHLPVITLADVGIGHWPFAGYTPVYHIMGKELANDVVEFLQTGKKKPITLADNKYIFDFERLKVLGLSLRGFKAPYESVNRPVSVFEEYFTTIIFVLTLLVTLSVGLIMSLSLLRRSRQLSAKLVKQGKELLIAKNNAEQANKMKSKFIANISHEIRTPLNAVMGFSQILISDQVELSAEEKKQYGDLILANSDLLLNLINDVLDISKIDAGKMQFNIKEYDVVALANTAVQSAMANKNPNVDIYMQTRFDHLMIDTDNARLMQVLTNLINNAKKCTEHGSICVGIDKYDGDNMILVSVTDTGCGIPKEKATEVFERFKKLDAFRQGTGLGLAICRAIIEELGGKIWVDTDYTDGARFVFTHPLHPNIVEFNEKRGGVDIHQL